MEETWRLFGNVAPGWGRVQAICDFVNQHVTFGYQYGLLHENGLPSLPRTPGRVSGLGAPGDHLLPMFEYSGALLHQLLRRYRRTDRGLPNGLRRLHGGVSE